MPLRISESVRLGPFRFRVSAPLTRRGRTWVSVGTRVGKRQYVSVSEPLGGRKRGKR